MKQKRYVREQEEDCGADQIRIRKKEKRDVNRKGRDVERKRRTKRKGKKGET